MADFNLPDVHSESRIGMDRLYDIVINMKRDLRRVNDALSLNGAQNIVTKHNKKCKTQGCYWKAENKDLNNDGIPDIVIRDRNNQPLVVNGWSTKGSKYPVRMAYYTDNPTREARKEKPFKQYVGEFMQREDIDNILDQMHSGQYKYSVKKHIITPYEYFCKAFIDNITNTCIDNLIQNDNHPLVLNNNNRWRDLIPVMAKVKATLWRNEILGPLATGNRYDLKNENHARLFKKSLKTPEGKNILMNFIQFICSKYSKEAKIEMVAKTIFIENKNYLMSKEKKEVKAEGYNYLQQVNNSVQEAPGTYYVPPPNSFNPPRPLSVGPNGQQFMEVNVQRPLTPNFNQQFQLNIPQHYNLSDPNNGRVEEVYDENGNAIQAPGQPMAIQYQTQ